jgi:hypothetical protein
MQPLANSLSLLLEALDRLGIRYLIGGSHASSARGVVRTTMDVDLLVRIEVARLVRLAEELGSAWYADTQTMRESVQAGRPFNIIHMSTGQKFDIFPVTDEFHSSELERATLATLHFSGFDITCHIATAEDILLAKLQWYRQGGEVSERQWSDVLGIMAANASLDHGYLRAWARRLGVDDLLTRAIDSSEPR